MLLVVSSAVKLKLRRNNEHKGVDIFFLEFIPKETFELKCIVALIL